jgi:hypothetical protein
MRAEDILPSDVDEAAFKDVTVRKGTVGAFLANIKVLSDPNASRDDHAAAERDLVDALPALCALGLFDALQIRDPRVRAIVDAGLAKLPLAD